MLYMYAEQATATSPAARRAVALPPLGGLNPGGVYNWPRDEAIYLASPCLPGEARRYRHMNLFNHTTPRPGNQATV